MLFEIGTDTAELKRMIAAAAWQAWLRAAVAVERRRPEACVLRLTVMRIPILVLCFAVAMASAVSAQDPPNEPLTNPEVTADARAVNPDQLGVSIDRIRLRFNRQALFGNAFDPAKLKLTAYVDVVGRAPALRLFGSDPKGVKEQLTSRAVPFGAPTHQDVIRLVTPEEFRTPPMDLTALINWLSQQFQKKDEK
jgi:hypothetical protein